MNFFLPKVYASFINHNLQYFSLPFKQYVMFHISYFPHRSPPPCWGKETRELYSGCTIMELTSTTKLISLSIYQGQRSTKQVRTCLKKNCYFSPIFFLLSSSKSSKILVSRRTCGIDWFSSLASFCLVALRMDCPKRDRASNDK